MLSLSATDANPEKQWRDFDNSLSQTELQDEWDEYWKPQFLPLKKGARFWLPPLSSALLDPCEQSISFTNHFPDLREQSARTPTQL